MENNSKLTNFARVYQSAIFRLDNLVILILGVLLSIFMGKFFVLGIVILLFGIGTKAFILSAKKDFINQTLNPKKTFEIKNLVQILTKELNKSYLEQVKINFQNARQELVKIQKNLELINKNQQNKNNSEFNSQTISFENTGFDNLEFLPQVLPPLVDKVLILSREEQKIRRFLQTENKLQITTDLANLQKLQENSQDLIYSDQNLNLTQNTKKEGQNQQIENKKNQLQTILNFEKQLDQIEDYLGKIQTELSAISLFTAKLSLPTSKITNDNYLLTSLNKLNLEIDTFTDQINEIK